MPRSNRPLWAILLLALACATNADTVTGRVVGVADGDTTTVLDGDKVQHKIRLAGMDAPEKKQPFGNRSKESPSEPRGLWRDADPILPWDFRHNKIKQ